MAPLPDTDEERLAAQPDGSAHYEGRKVRGNLCRNEEGIADKDDEQHEIELVGTHNIRKGCGTGADRKWTPSPQPDRRQDEDANDDESGDPSEVQEIAPQRRRHVIASDEQDKQTRHADHSPLEAVCNR
jgi:hypothetical protein